MAPPKKLPFTPLQKLWVKLVVSGATRKEILDKVFHVDLDAHPEDANRCDVRISRWRRHPDYEKEWNAAYREVWGEITQEAMKELRNGLHDDDLPWRRTQHVNMALTYGSKIISGEESNTIKIQIEGMPELGSPDQDDGK